MLKIVVFDGGWGGENVANFLDQELGIVEVIRVIDWANAPYETKTSEQIIELVEENLRSYIGRADAIVLAGYSVSEALPSLRQKYPKQRFVGMGLDYVRILRSRYYPSNTVILANAGVQKSQLCQECGARLKDATLILPDCRGWEELANEDLLTPEILKAELKCDFVMNQKVRVPTKRARQQQKNLEAQQKRAQAATMKALRASIDQLQKDEIRLALKNLEQLSKRVAEPETVTRRPLVENYRYQQIRPDLVLILNTHFWDLKDAFVELFGWKTRVLDFREKLFRDVCTALHLKGIDGKRAK